MHKNDPVFVRRCANGWMVDPGPDMRMDRGLVPMLEQTHVFEEWASLVAWMTAHMGEKPRPSDSGK